MLWEVLIRPFEDQPDREAGRVLQEAQSFQAASIRELRSGHSFLIQTASDQQAVSRAAAALLVDPLVETMAVHRVASGADAVFEGMEQAVVSAIKKQVGEASQIEFAINRETGNPTLTVNGQHVSRDEIGVLLGRAAAQTASEVIREQLQAIKEGNLPKRAAGRGDTNGRDRATGANALRMPAEEGRRLINVLFKPGVTDNVGQSTKAALIDLGLPVEEVATCRKYWVNADAVETDLQKLARPGAGERRDRARRLGPAASGKLSLGSAYQFELVTVPIRGMDDAELTDLSRTGQLYLSLRRDADDPRALRRSERAIPPTSSWKRSPRPGASTARTKRSAGAFTIATKPASCGSTTCSRRRFSPRRRTIRERLGKDDWCVSVFKDNAGVVKFDDKQLRLLQGRDAQPSLGPGAVRRREHGTGRRDSRSARHGAWSAARLQHRRLLLRAPRYAVRIAAAGRPASAHGGQGRGGGRPRLRQPHGDPDGERRDLFRPAVPRQSARLLRQRRHDSGRQDRKANAARRSDRGRRRADRSRRHSRRDLFVRPS